MNLLRTLHLALATLIPMLTGLTWGLLVALLTGSRRRGLNQMTRLLAWLGPLLAGTPLHLKSAAEACPGPAVYLFNHQSGLDPILLCYVIRRNVVAIAKSKWRQHPVIGPLLWFGETVFIDEKALSQSTDRAAARYESVYQPAIDILHRGRSLAIAPEGTRISDRLLGDFKLGAFRIAQLAQVPIIPIVIYNAGERLPAGGTRLYPGAIHMEVLSPVYPEQFQSSIEATAEEIRSRYVNKLQEFQSRRQPDFQAAGNK